MQLAFRWACFAILAFAATGRSWSRVLSPQHTNADSALAGIEQGQALLAGKRYQDAMDCFETVLRAYPDNESAHTGEVQAANASALEEINAQRPEQAMATLERALTFLPRDPDLLLNFGIEAIALKQVPIAQQALAASDALRPHYPKTLYAMARLAMLAGHLDDAEQDMRRYLALQPSDGSAWFGLGHILAGEQKKEEAQQALEHSIQLQPQQTESYLDLGRMVLEAHEDTDAEEEFSKVLARAPHHAGALTGMGQLALRARQYERAEKLLAQAEQSDPDYTAPHYFRGLALLKLGRKQEAEQELARGDSRQHAAGSPQRSEAGATNSAPQ